MMKLMKVSVCGEWSHQGRCWLCVGVVVVLWRHLRGHTDPKTLRCCRQLTWNSCKMGGDGLGGRHSHWGLAIQRGVGVGGLGGGSHELWGASRGQERASGVVAGRDHGGIVVLGAKTTTIHLVLVMEWWI